MDQNTGYTTIGRKKILEYLQENRDKVVGISDIVRYLENIGTPKNVSTIYRYLNELVKEGKVLKHKAAKGEAATYQYTSGECHSHLHLQCNDCGKIVHLNSSFMFEIEDHLHKDHGFFLECSSSVLRGICEGCRAYILFIVFLCCVMVSACGQTAEKPASGEDRLRIVCTTFPQYDWTKEILGERADQVELTLLLDTGVDIHNFQPSVADIAKITDCDLFIYVGGESEGWVEDVLCGAINENINLIESLGGAAKVEVGHDEHDGHDGHDEYDEHVWLSLRNAEKICEIITDSLKKLDNKGSEIYDNNLDSYREKLLALDKKYQSVADTAKGNTLLFGDRFPFRYLTDDYGLAYYAAFPGCFAETEASFESIAYLAGKVDELALASICVSESSDQSIARTIISNTQGKDQDILVLDSLQSVNEEDIKNGTAYLSIMECNLEVLKQALN